MKIYDATYLRIVSGVTTNGRRTSAKIYDLWFTTSAKRMYTWIIMYVYILIIITLIFVIFIVTSRRIWFLLRLWRPSLMLIWWLSIIRLITVWCVTVAATAENCNDFLNTRICTCKQVCCNCSKKIVAKKKQLAHDILPTARLEEQR